MRVSLNRRLDRLLDVLCPPGSFEHALDQLSDDQRAAFEQWRERADRSYSAAENWAANVYEAYLSDPLVLPSMPRALSYALFPYLRDVDNAPNAARAWQIMLQRGIE